MSRSPKRLNVWIVYSDLFINLTVFVSLAAIGMAVLGIGSSGAGGGTPDPCVAQRESLADLDAAFEQLPPIKSTIGCSSFFLVEDIDLNDLYGSGDSLDIRAEEIATRFCNPVVGHVTTALFRERKKQLDFIAIHPDEPDFDRDLGPIPNSRVPEKLVVAEDRVVEEWDGVYNCKFRNDRATHGPTCDVIRNELVPNSPDDYSLQRIEYAIEQEIRIQSRERLQAPLETLINRCVGVIESEKLSPAARDNAVAGARETNALQRIVKGLGQRSILKTDFELPDEVIARLPEGQASVIIRVRTPVTIPEL